MTTFFQEKKKKERLHHVLRIINTEISARSKEKAYLCTNLLDIIF